MRSAKWPRPADTRVPSVSILRDGVPIGSIAFCRAQAGLLPDQQVELLKPFADQAVIE